MAMAREPKTLEDLNAAEIGNQILAPLLVGLHSGVSGPYAEEMDKLKTEVPLGVPTTYATSFRNPERLRIINPGNNSKPYKKPEISYLTSALDEIHQQLIDICYNFGNLFNLTKFSDDTIRGLSNFFGSSSYVHTTTAPYYNSLIEELSVKKLSKVPLRFNTNKLDTPVELWTEIEVDNIPIGPLKGSLAHTMYSLHLLGVMAGARSFKPEWKHFITLAIPGKATDAIPPIQAAVLRHLADQLSSLGYNAGEIMSNSGCDFDRIRLRQCLEDLLPYAEIYQIAAEARGEKKQDYFSKTLDKIKKYTGKSSSEPACRDAYECSLLLEAMIAYATTQSKSKELDNLKNEFIGAISPILERMVCRLHGELIILPEPTKENILKLRESQMIIEAFTEAYANSIFIGREEPAADKLWATKIRSGFSESDPSIKI